MNYKIYEESPLNSDLKPFLCKKGNIMLDKNKCFKTPLTHYLIGVYKDGIRYYLEININTGNIVFKQDNKKYINSNW
jgi:hypothetical protein